MTIGKTDKPVRLGCNDVSGFGGIFSLGSAAVEEFDGFPGNSFQERFAAPSSLAESPLIRFTDHDHPRQGLIELVPVHGRRDHS